MRQFTIAAATVAIAALISAAPASADRIQGGPIVQNGQCLAALKRDLVKKQIREIEQTRLDESFAQYNSFIEAGRK